MERSHILVLVQQGTAQNKNELVIPGHKQEQTRSTPMVKQRVKTQG